MSVATGMQATAIQDFMAFAMALLDLIRIALSQKYI
jgi:hypothetical protein